MLRVVYYAAGWPPERYANGIVSSLGVLAPALRELGCDARILACAGAANDDEKTVSYLNLRPPLAARLQRKILGKVFPGSRQSGHDVPDAIIRAINAARVLKRADIFEIEESFGWSAALRERIRTPLVVALHGPWFLTGAAQTPGGLDSAGEDRIRKEGAALREADHISARSRFVLEEVRKKYAIEAPDAVVIPNAVTPVEKHWSLKDADPNRILFIGRFDRVKGADIALRAFAKLAVERPSLRLTFVGPSHGAMPITSRTYSRDDYVAEIMPPEAARRIEFTGFLPITALSEIRRRAFVTIVPSRIETFGNTFAEALACGCPAVASRAGGIPEIARDGEATVLVPPEDPDALARAIETFLDQPEMAARLAESGRRRVESEFAPKRIAEMTMDYYRELIAKQTQAQG